jgi:hypothetical protein
VHVSGADLERYPNPNRESGMQAHEDMVMEEMQLRRWRSMRMHKVDSDLN